MSQVLMGLETPRLLLRRFQDNDLAAFLPYRNDLEVAKYQTWDPPYLEMEAMKFIQSMQQSTPGVLGEWYQLAIVLKDTGEMIRDCAFCILADRGRLTRSHQVIPFHSIVDTNHFSFFPCLLCSLCSPCLPKCINLKVKRYNGYATEAVRRLLEYLFTGHNPRERTLSRK
ncbi:MAG: GNAT family N-acetyltransferase [Nostoc sp. ChiSLP02]|nr:GNAT family N-acetyltransferase [Nostoc sp. DedSLP05]MDZ8099613.1 GNAT family N-acetyltransferase [Nostoc sp. DedSLP01]MDZ8186131.1 GNAT family N-acetyltransferase [Nostoc sp. ChiSLP02]